jgi:hypothetical protein
LPVFNIAERNHYYAFAPAALELDAMSHDFREQVAAFTAMRCESVGINRTLHRTTRARDHPS